MTRKQIEALEAKHAGTSQVADDLIAALWSKHADQTLTADRRHDASEIGFGSYRTNTHLEAA